jgi:hypothetical protein
VIWRQKKVGRVKDKVFSVGVSQVCSSPPHPSSYNVTSGEASYDPSTYHPHLSIMYTTICHQQGGAEDSSCALGESFLCGSAQYRSCHVSKLKANGIRSPIPCREKRGGPASRNRGRGRGEEKGKEGMKERKGRQLKGDEL